LTVVVQQAIQDAHAADALGIEPDPALMDAVAERNAAIEQLKLASEQPLPF
jgi:hypothetical protein